MLQKNVFTNLVVLSLQRHLFKVNFNNLEMFICMSKFFVAEPKFQYLSKLTLFDTSMTIKTWPKSFVFQMWIHVEDNMPWIKILIVLKNIFIIWYMKFFLFVLFIFAYVIFWYEHFNGGFEWPKNNVGKVVFFIICILK